MHIDISQLALRKLTFTPFLQQVSIWHDGKGVDAHWFLEDVTIVDASNRRSVTNRYKTVTKSQQPVVGPLRNRNEIVAKL